MRQGETVCRKLDDQIGSTPCASDLETSRFRFPDLKPISNLDNKHAKTKIPPEKELFCFYFILVKNTRSGGSWRRAKKPREDFAHANSPLSSTVG